MFLLDAALLDRLAVEKLQTEAEALKAEGWKWVEATPELDYETRGGFRVRQPEPLPLSEEAEAEHVRLAAEYESLYDGSEEYDDETSERLDAIDARMEELSVTDRAYGPDVLAIAGAIVTLGRKGEPEVLRGIVRPEDEPEDDREPAASKPGRSFRRRSFRASPKPNRRPSARRSPGSPASLSRRWCMRWRAASFAYTAATAASSSPGRARSCASSPGERRNSTSPTAKAERLPEGKDALWHWCLAQDQGTLLDLLAYCAARTVNAVQAKHDRPDSRRLAHANALAAALSLDLTKWFTPTASNFFSRVGRATILSAMAEAKGTPAKRSWDKLKKPALAALAERETAGTAWLPQPLRA